MSPVNLRQGTLIQINSSRRTSGGTATMNRTTRKQDTLIPKALPETCQVWLGDARWGILATPGLPLDAYTPADVETISGVVYRHVYEQYPSVVGGISSKDHNFPTKQERFNLHP